MTTPTSRKAWQIQQRRPDPAAVFDARRGVSIRADIYGTERQIAAALVELNCAWAAADTAVREANVTARAILPAYGKRLRTAAEADAYQGALDRLTPPLRHLVQYAETLRENRRLAGVWATALEAGRLGDGGEVPAVLDDAGRYPHAALLFGRLTTARNAATVQALRDAEAAPVDDVAWFAAQQSHVEDTEAQA
jgi:hypothetical protein